MSRRPRWRKAARSSAILGLVSLLVAACSTGASQPDSSTAPGLVVGLGVPWAVGLPRPAGGHDEGEWPPFAVPALRLWDSRTTWRDLQPSPGRWNFGTLDALLATASAHGTSDVTLVLAGTPQWASVRASISDAPWIGPGSASPPRDLREWSSYVSTVAARYRGRIGTYEVGNEPNLPTFWNGSPAEWAAYVAVAAAAVHAVDPSATIVADVGLLRGARDLPAVGRFAGLAAVSPYVDAFAVHAYPSRRTLETMPEVLTRARELMAVVGTGGRPVWVTEANVSDGSRLSVRGQRAAVRGLTRAIASAGYARAYWYAWTALGPTNLIQLAPRTPGAVALQQVIGGGAYRVDSVDG